ncbi:MAG: MmgE/PrpD family protein [Nitrososphaerota archaeon]
MERLIDQRVSPDSVCGEAGMTDSISKRIAELALSAGPIRLRVLHEAKRRILDSLGCYFGAWDEGSVRVARESAVRYGSCVDGAMVWGLGVKASLEWAAFSNAVGVRALDFNDTYLSLEPLHPSDMIPAIMAVGEHLNASGIDVLEAIAVGYEVGCRLCDSATLRKRGWDHVNYTMLGAVAALSKLMSLSHERTMNALSIAVVPHVAMRQTRAGELSMWKGAAAANACRNAVFAALLASRGMTGPSQPFEGEMGFYKQVSGTPFPPEVWADTSSCQAILRTYIKYHPVEYHAQSAVDAALQIYSELGGSGEIDSVRVETFEAAYTILVKDPEKWRPMTRETADHSLPFIVAAALHDGGVWLDTFSPPKLESGGIRRLMGVMEVLEDESLTRRYPAEIPNRITVKTRGSGQVVREVSVPRGHARNPMTDEEVVSKFHRLASHILDTDRRNAIVETLWRLDKLQSIGEFTALLGRVGE